MAASCRWSGGQLSDPNASRRRARGAARPGPAGADFSDRAIQLARSLAGELGLGATVDRSDLYDLPAVLDGQFDVVYSSPGGAGVAAGHGALGGGGGALPAPGRVFYVTEIHRVAQAFAEEPELRLGHP